MTPEFPDQADNKALYECCLVLDDALRDVLSISDNFAHLPGMHHIRNIARRGIEDAYQIVKKEDEAIG